MQPTIHSVPPGTLGVEVRDIIAAAPRDSTHVIVHIDARDHVPSLYCTCTSEEEASRAWGGMISAMQNEHQVYAVGEMLQ